MRTLLTLLAVTTLATAAPIPKTNYLYDEHFKNTTWDFIYGNGSKGGTFTFYNDGTFHNTIEKDASFYYFGEYSLDSTTNTLTLYEFTGYYNPDNPMCYHNNDTPTVYTIKLNPKNFPAITGTATSTNNKNIPIEISLKNPKSIPANSK